MESFNGRLRDELLAVEQFDTLLDAQVVIEDWRTDYNTRRPHSSLGQQPPAVYAANYRTTHPLTLIKGGPTTGDRSLRLSEAVNLFIKRIKGAGFRIPQLRHCANYRLRLLLHCDVSWHTHRTTRIRDRHQSMA